MKFLRNVLIVSMLIALQCTTSSTLAYVAQSPITQSSIAQSPIAQKSFLKKTASKKIATQPAFTKQNKTTLSNIPYIKELHAANFPAAQKQSLITAWQHLYEQYQAKNSTTRPVALTHAQAAAIAPIFTTNFLAQMHTYFSNKQNFATLPDDAQNLKKQYATLHMAQACARLASVHRISFENNTPKTHFTGDVRDQGIIVNIKNNTDTKFSISQNSLDGKNQTHIGVINPGLNGANLHTAALQEPNAKQSAAQANTVYSFNFEQLDADTPTNIAIKMYTGTELIKFLETLPRKDKNVFSMNGLPTSKDFLTNPDDWYMVLIQNPTSKNQPQPNLDQRIQAINISKLTGPYLLSIQINEETVEISAELEGQASISLDLFQPSITDALIPKNQYLSMQHFPVIILSKFLADMPHLQTLWMLHTTAHIASLSDFKFLGLNSFGNTFEYFEKMGFFNMNNSVIVFIDLYNRFKPSYSLYNVPWLIAQALYETDLSTCSDIPQIYTAQDSYGRTITNGTKFYYTTFRTTFTPQSHQTANQMIFNSIGFNSTYALPRYNIYTLIINALHHEIEEGIFASLTLIKPGVFKLTWTNKKNKIINSQYLYNDGPISNIDISFLSRELNLVGTSIPTNLIPITPGMTTHFKVTYEFSPANNKHILLAQPTSPIDKVETILTLQFSRYPIQELYIDVFHTFNAMPYTRCFVIKDGILPTPLITLTQQEWQEGIYMIPTVKNNEQITPENPGALTLVFYKSDKAILGEITLEGQFNNSIEKGIKEPVHAYNPHFSESNCLRGLYLSTGILLQYMQQS